MGRGVLLINLQLHAKLLFIFLLRMASKRKRNVLTSEIIGDMKSVQCVSGVPKSTVRDIW